MTAINLEKGQSIDFSKVKNLKNLSVELKWLVPGKDDFDADVSAFILGEDQKLLSSSHFIFYNNLESPNGAVASGGDVRSSGDEDGENIDIRLDELDKNAHYIDIIVSVHNKDHADKKRKDHFGEITKGNLTLRDQNGDDVLAHFDFSKGEFDGDTIIHAARLSRTRSGWEATAIGDGRSVTLQDLVNHYLPS